MNVLADDCVGVTSNALMIVFFCDCEGSDDGFDFQEVWGSHDPNGRSS